MLKLKDTAIVVLEIAGRRYAVCDHPVSYADGTPVRGEGSRCGALVDVTDWRGIARTASCGSAHNHVLPAGPDAVVLP